MKFVLNMVSRLQGLVRAIRLRLFAGKSGHVAGRRSEALHCNDEAIRLQGLGRFAEALESYERAIELDARFAGAWINRGTVLADLGRHEAAIESYDHALTIRPDSADAWIHKGNAQSALLRHESALESYLQAAALEPDYAEAHYNCGEALLELKRPEAALASFARARELKPGLENALGLWVHAKTTICDWSGLADARADLAQKVESGQAVCPPFPLLAISDSPALHRIASERWIQARHPQNDDVNANARRSSHDRIRIGYFSADFHEHATSYLMVELLERHDRSRFEVTGFSFGPDKQDTMRERVSAACERFVDVRGLPDAEVAALARSLGIDVAVDLKGFCQDSRTGIFALRAAPVQVNFLGYPGTLGAGYIDYLIADEVLIPASHRRYYAEKIAYLPDSYQPNDTRRRIADKVPGRAALGLPSEGFVFCCFNNNFKITPEVFTSWMRILETVDGSVLWLLEDNPAAARNLRAEAAARGIDPHRLVFAPRLPLPDHLARHAAADLFLDTLPCNAHTTASDALWAGLPVLTRMGESFSGRVAASLLGAIGLADLVTDSAEAYERLAVALAMDSGRMRSIKDRLAANRLSSPLFDSTRFARHIEAAFEQMHARHLAGEAPDHLFVRDVSAGA